MMNRRMVSGIMFVLTMLVGLSACDQLEMLKNNKTRISGTWYLYEHGFKDDSEYYFSEGIIKRDDSAWGSYKFAQHSTIEVDLDGEPQRYNLVFTDDDEVMTWTVVDQGTDQVRYEWRRR